jgi:hypothetical protein
MYLIDKFDEFDGTKSKSMEARIAMRERWRALFIQKVWRKGRDEGGG